MTKTSSLLLAALLAGAGAAHAAPGQVFHDSPFERSDVDTVVSIDRVDAPAPGMVAIYDYRLGRQGRLLASKAMDAGTNWDVRLRLGAVHRDDVIAVFTVDGRAVERRVIDHGDN